MDAIPDYGWAAALVAVLMVVVAPLMALWAKRERKAEEREKEIEDAEAKYRDAARSGDNLRAAAAAARLRRLRNG